MTKRSSAFAARHNSSLHRAAHLLPCLLSLAVSQAWAEANPVNHDPTMSTVVVTASGTAIDIKDAPASISVITREEIERQPVYDLNTLLRRIPGVTGGTSPVGDESKIKLRGLPDKYTLILVDGKRVGSSADTSYRPDLGRQDLNWISPDMIERIEVVRGPMSSLYGSDAMGGVINIITRKVPGKWNGSATANYTQPQDSGRGTAHQLSLNLAGPLSEAVGMRIGVAQSRQNPDEKVIGKAGGIGGERNQSITGQLNWALNSKHSLSLDASYGRQEASDSSTQDAEGYPLFGAWGASKLIRKSAALGYEGRWDFGKTRVNLYHNDYDNQYPGTVAKSRDDTLDASLEKRLGWGVEQLLVMGAQWKHEELTNTDIIGTVPTDYLGNPVSGATLSGTTSALFAEDQLFLRDNLTATIGWRLDHHGKFGNHHSPRLYLVYHPAPEWTVKGGISQGFRAPSLKENSPASATNSGGRGCTSLYPLGYIRGECFMAGNPDLQPETSTAAEIGIAYEKNGWDAGLTYFHTDFKNKIDYAPLGFYQNKWWTRMSNIQKARTSGLEGSLTIPLTKHLNWRNNLTYMAEAKNLTLGTNLLATPKVSLYSALGWQATDQLFAEVSAQYTGKELDAGARTSTRRPPNKAYTIVDTVVSYKVTPNWTLRGGLENLFKKGPANDGLVEYYVPGRRMFVGLTSRF
ncbi:MULTISPECIES: TonB-dependent receptor domain-containing protein [unclassified Janthinobacterium]|uniref:TonB-dependent receptor domain-containing protein n=1 Tax=unclassified Janthinobacterium TaxID=2610881 RepID=UPI001613E993|nr:MULTISPECIES: TonB-dependent receptor [unclassified Janthinobacterium]MBB5609716.1 outer membrane receptor for ferrienterochelin and colicins [Janthinobacterium sp. S3T4]MBB5614888.1 outer membrane receptor for ferrienterochelin and colicins [Janthinobacterium sp. S3M3]